MLLKRWIMYTSAFLLLSVTARAETEEEGQLSENSRTKRRSKVLDLFCSDQKDGQILTHPDDCKSYIFCSGGFGYKSKCAPGLYYDSKLHTCNYDDGTCDRNKVAGGMRPDRPPRPIHSDTPSPIKSLSAPRRPPDGELRKPPSPRLQPKHGPPDRGPPDHGPPFRGEPIDPLIDDRLYRDHKLHGSGPLRGFCEVRPDGTYAHPADCESYVLCSNGSPFASTCPDNLVYNERLEGCDFDLDASCHRAPEYPPRHHLDRHSEGPAHHLRRGPRFELPLFDLPGGRGPQLSRMMPEAIDRAMRDLTDRLLRETKMAEQLDEHLDHLFHADSPPVDRPFRFVQRFLRSKPLARQLSLPAFILDQASERLLDELDMGHDEGLALLRTLSSPLPPSAYRVQSDEPYPQPEPGTCPWPIYNCKINKFRSFDGSCNNLHQPLRGRAFTPLRRLIHADYGDGIRSLRRAHDHGYLPDARQVSYTISPDQDVPHHLHTMMVLQWGQFLDHDMTLTAISKIVTDPTGYGKTADIECGYDGCSRSHEACAPIHVSKHDPHFFGKKCLEFVRSQEVPSLNCSMGAREQLNQITSYLDASNVYGSTREEAILLRDFTNNRRGKLKMIPHPFSSSLKHLLPHTHEDKECTDFDSIHQCFRAGDERVNEQAALTVMHTMWAREHNRIEQILHRLNPKWNGEALYQETRRIIGAMMQHITFNEFLPVVLGEEQMRLHQLQLLEQGYYGGYDSYVDASVGNAFASAAFRFGHSLIPPTLSRVNSSYSRHSHTNLSLSELFFRPRHIYDTTHGGIDAFCRGLCDQKIQSFDRFVSKEVTVHLFAKEPHHGLGTDLVALNIQRGRDHGLPGYIRWRSWCGLSVATSFDTLEDIIDKTVREKFKQVYRHVSDIDLFPAGLAERPVTGGLVGPTFACIIGRQFRDSRTGDRFWYENSGAFRFTEAQLTQLRKASLARMLCDNADSITAVQPRVMELPIREAFPDKNDASRLATFGLDSAWLHRLWAANYNQRVNCSCIPQIDLSLWREL